MKGKVIEVKVPCVWCGELTSSTGTKMCDGCWELSSRIRAQPVIAIKILAAILREWERVASERTH